MWRTWLPCQNFAIYTVGDHPYITSAKGLGGWIKKMPTLADVQYCIQADIVLNLKP